MKKYLYLLILINSSSSLLYAMLPEEKSYIVLNKTQPVSIISNLKFNNQEELQNYITAIIVGNKKMFENMNNAGKTFYDGTTTVPIDTRYNEEIYRNLFKNIYISKIEQLKNENSKLNDDHQKLLSENQSLAEELMYTTKELSKYKKFHNSKRRSI